MTPKQNTEAGTSSLKQNSVAVETLESRMCLSAAATAAVSPMLQYAVRAEMRQLAHAEFHAEQVVAYHAATTVGFRGDEYHDHDVRIHLGGGLGGGDFQHDVASAPVGGFIANLGGGMVKMIIIRLDGDGQLPAHPPSFGGGQMGDTDGGTTISPSYGGNPVTEPVISPPPVVQPVVGKPTETPPVQQPSSDQTSSGSAQQQQQRRRVAPSLETTTTTTTTASTTIQAPLAIDSRSLRSIASVASTSHLAAAVLSDDAQAAEGTFTTRFGSALKSLTPANFADLSVARLAGAGESTFLHSFTAAVPTQAAARVEGVLADAVASATARPRFFEFTHLGSPFALLSDSMANFVEDSASLPMAVAKAPKAGPWTLTATVVAADVILLTYMYRRSQRNRRRYQLAHGYAYSPFAS